MMAMVRVFMASPLHPPARRAGIPRPPAGAQPSAAPAGTSR